MSSNDDCLLKSIRELTPFASEAKSVISEISVGVAKDLDERECEIVPVKGTEYEKFFETTIKIDKFSSDKPASRK